MVGTSRVVCTRYRIPPRTATRIDLIRWNTDFAKIVQNINTSPQSTCLETTLVNVYGVYVEEALKTTQLLDSPKLGMLSRKKKARNGGVAHFILALHDTKRAHCRHLHWTLTTQLHYTGFCGTCVHGACVARWEVPRALAVIGVRVRTRTHPQSATRQDSVKKHS